MKKLLLFAALAVVFIATPAMAKEGPYFGGSLVSSTITGSDLNDFYDPSGGVELRLGFSFGSIAIEGNLLSVDQMGAAGFADADFTAATIDLRLSFSQTNDPTQVFFLAGLGTYSLEDFSGELTGGGVNLGGGIEHFFNEQVALDIRGVYRFITYDEFDGAPIADVNGDAFTLGVGLNLHF